MQGSSADKRGAGGHLRGPEWVAILSSDRIVGVSRLDTFLRSIREGRHGIPPQIARVRALYALTEPDGVVRASCAFTLGFDPRGEIPRDFALPLRELALNSGDGPDLGAGPIQSKSVV